jgi:hypothetical protein
LCVGGVEDISVKDFEYRYLPIEFVTLKDGSEGLIIYESFDNKSSYKFLDPFLPSDAINIDIIYDNKNIITKFNKKISIKNEDNVYTVCIEDGLNEDTFQQILNKNTYHSNIYTTPIFNKIKNMLENMTKSNKVCNFPENKKKELRNGEMFRFIFEMKDSGRVRLFGEHLQNDKCKETQNSMFFKYTDIFLYDQLDNQDLALITKKGILIYTIAEDFLELRYFWNNKDWNEKFDSKNYIEYILKNKFILSLPSPNFKTLFEKIKKEKYKKHKNTKYKKYEKYFKSIINDPVKFSKFGLEMLEIAINEKDDGFVFIVQSIFDKIIELIDDSENYNYISFLPFISLNLSKLCNPYYSNLVMKYFSHTSIILDPAYSSAKNSTNTSLCAYSKNIYIKQSSSNNNCLKSLAESLLLFYKKLASKLKIQEKTPKIRFIVPFPQIYKYNNSSWNEILYKQKSILFCNIDTNNFYKWWNFAAIIDFKWKVFGRTYYYLNWFFYTIFFICFILPLTFYTNFIINKVILIIIPILLILFGFIYLIIEIRQCLWKPQIYFSDPWNVIGK